jgi:transcriptional regulator with XRE-family HTH domain
MKPAKPLGEVMASNVKAIRQAQGLTQTDLANAARCYGLVWERSNVVTIEGGGKRLHFDEVVVLAAALGVPITDLTRPPGAAVSIHAGIWKVAFLDAVIEGRVDEYDGPEFTSDHLRSAIKAAMAGVDAASKWRRDLVNNLEQRWGLDPQTSRGEMRRITGWNDPEDVKAANWIERKVRLGVTPGEVMIASEHLWGRSFKAERDARMRNRQGATPQAQGRETLKMRKELLTAIEEAATKAAKEMK